ncbi:MAG: hypothetical protein J6C89_02940, partial [Clostridia bacterium]|nr:hypothetical protein [Clostridia bacterium]
DALNVWRDYKKTQGVETRPATEIFAEFSEKIFGIYVYGDALIVHSGTKLWRLENGQKTLLYEGVQESRSAGFVFKSTFYFKDGKHYLQYNGESMTDVEGYVPTTCIGKSPNGTATTHEDVNMLSPFRINSFLSDGTFEYYLDATDIDEDFVPICTVYGEEVTGFTVDYAEGKIRFEEAPIEPLTAGQDTVLIKFKKTVPGYADNVLRSTLLEVFDNRVFVSGNPDFPNVVWHSSLYDPTYFSDLDYYREGLDDAAVRGLAAGNNALWVFREPNDANTTIFYHTPTTDAKYGKVYPSVHSSVNTGCIGGAINFGDDIVFFSREGMMSISGDVTTEQVVAHRSSLVDRKMTALVGYEDMVLAEWDGYLLVFIGDKVFLADSRAMFKNEQGAEYEWFYWELPFAVCAAVVKEGVLYLGTKDGIYTLTDRQGALESYWVTPKDKFGAQNKQKTTNKRGCVAEATGDICVYAKTENTDFELIGSYTGITDYFTSRIKRKKFKDIQLKFYSQTRMSLESVSLEAWIGGYIKRYGA